MLKTKKETLNDGICFEILDFKYLNFFFSKKNSFAEFFDKISDPYNKTPQKF